MGVGLSRWQVVRQVVYRVGERRWQEGAAERVIHPDNVIPTAGAPEEVYGNLRAGPFALVRIGGSTAPDAENPHLLATEVRVALGIAGSGDKTGAGNLVGTARTAATVGSSGGRGLLEIEEEILAELARGDAAVGFNATVAWASGTEAGILAGRPVTVATYGLRVLCTRARGYHPPQNLVATALGGGQVSLSWSLPPDRYDRSAIALRRAAGSTAPASASAGTEVTLASALATSVTVSGLTAGAHSFAVFGAYDEHRGSALRYSDQATGTTRTVVVT